MISQIEAAKWIRRLRATKIRKGIQKLHYFSNGVEKCCCLGIQANAKYKERKVTRTFEDSSYSYSCNPRNYYNSNYYDAKLPPSLRKELKVSLDGRLTKEGNEITKKYLKDKYNIRLPKDQSRHSLITLNDGCFSKDKNFIRIANVIEYLAFIERVTGTECFMN